MENLARSLNYDSDKISQSFFEALTEINYHYEAILLEKIWHAMANADYCDASDRHKLKAAALHAIQTMEL
jgi:hypothetical protein